MKKETVEAKGTSSRTLQKTPVGSEKVDERGNKVFQNLYFKNSATADKA